MLETLVTNRRLQLLPNQRKRQGLCRRYRQLFRIYSTSGQYIATVSVVVTTPSFTETHVFIWDLVDMTSTHELPTRYRQLLGMLGRSAYEKVTDPSMLLLLGLG